MTVSTANFPAQSWEFVALSGETTLQRTSRAIRIGGAGDLYAHIGGGAEVKVAEGLEVGEIVPIQTDKIGASTTCTKMTVFHQDR